MYSSYYHVIKSLYCSANFFFRGHLKDFLYKKSFLKYNSVFKIFELFLVRVFFSIDVFRKNLVPRKALSEKEILIKNNLIFDKDINFSDTYRNFYENGFCKIGLLNKNFYQNLLEELFPEIVNFKDRDNFFLDFIDKQKEARGRITIKPNNTNKFIGNLFNSELVKTTTEYYLGTRNIVHSSALFVSYNYESATLADFNRNAQSYHSDCRYKKFFKIFVYLNDVNALNGPHCFVKTTHNKKLSNFNPLKSYSDKVVSDNFSNNIVSIEGPAGLFFLEDTFGLHKGKAIQHGYRAVLVLEVGIGNQKYDNNHFFVKNLTSQTL